MSLVFRVGKDGKPILPSKEDIQREKSRMDRLKRRAADYKRKRREEKRLDRKNVRTPPGKPGVGIGRKNLTRKVPGTKAPGSGTRVRRPAPGFKPLSAAEMAKAQRRAAIKKLREEQAKKRPTVKKKATRRKAPGKLSPLSSMPERLSNRKNPVGREIVKKLVRRQNTRGRRSQPKKGKGF